MDKMTSLKEAVSEAERRHYAIKDEMRDAIREAEARVRATFADRMNESLREVSDAKCALQQHIDATASHEWEGKRVVRVEQLYGNHSRIPYKTVVEYGFVEVRRSGTVFPDNAKYRMPAMGEPFVRLEKKDGMIGMRFERFNSAWKLAEGEA